MAEQVACVGFLAFLVVRMAGLGQDVACGKITMRTVRMTGRPVMGGRCRRGIGARNRRRACAADGDQRNEDDH